MDKRTYELLLQLKKKYEACGGRPIYQVSVEGPDESARQFYLESLEDNLVRPMSESHRAQYAEGSGSELDDKMKALRSSSAMTFNLLGNEYCEVGSQNLPIPAGVYAVRYEVQFPTLKNGLPANLDVLLTREDGAVIACEMKMLEWLSVPAALKDKYLEKDNYRFSDTAETFVSVAHELLSSDRFVRYDYAQMFKHTLALYNAQRSDELGATSLMLLNCVWEPSGDFSLSNETATWLEALLAEEHDGFKEFQRVLQPTIQLFKEELGIDFAIEYCDAASVALAIDRPAEEKKLILRYL